MNIRDYQEIAAGTDQAAGTDLKGLMIPLLGLAGETGTLLTEYKKHLRDGPAYAVFKERIEEELGDILWYASTIATKAGLSLETIVQRNVRKIQNRWQAVQPDATGSKLFDDDYPVAEQLPRQFRLSIAERDVAGATVVRLIYDGAELGDPLTDNAYKEDAYRFHDVFHLAYAAVLGWSPVVRKLMGRKRRSNPRTDEVEDGGRARVIDEAVAALVFSHAATLGFFEAAHTVDYEVLRTIQQLTQHLEVSRVSLKQWSDAILAGYDVWRQVRANRGGTVVGDMAKKTLVFAGH